MENDKKWPRIKHIMGKYYYRPKAQHPKSIKREYLIKKILGQKVKELEVFFGLSPKSEESRERVEVFNFFKKYKLDENDIESIWRKVKEERWRQRPNDLNKKPLVERKDNLNPKTNGLNYGSGGGGYSSIRVPSKKRRNKYKNFLKRFPNYK